MLYTGASTRKGFSMRLKTFASAFALVFLTNPAFHLPAQNAPVKLTIHADQPVSSVSPTLYGLMTEEINYSYDGGLYAEMVRNRTFRSDWTGFNFCSLVESANPLPTMKPPKTPAPSTPLTS